MSTKKGKFIVLDGSEGSGKTSQLEALKKDFGDQIITTREPGGTPYAEEIRNIILKSENAKQADAKTHFALFWAARADNMKNKIIPAIESGKTIITDRFDSTTFAYQIFAQEAKELSDNFFDFRDFFLGSCKPDLYIYLDVDVETGLSRRLNQKDQINHFDERQIEFFRKAKIGFSKFFEKVPHKIVDANQSFDAVNRDLVDIISEII